MTMKEGHTESPYNMMMRRTVIILSVLLTATPAAGFTAHRSSAVARLDKPWDLSKLYSSPNDEVDNLGEKFGGFTTKQRLREEIESPFRKVRLAFFSFSGVSAFVALYFSALVRSP